MARNIIDTLIIHDNDNDGFGSAWAAYKYFGLNADYHALSHGTNELPIKAFAYENVYIFDLSFPREELCDLMEDGVALWVIDHHASAKKMLEGLGFPVDTTRAACTQVWDYFHAEEAPKLLQYVEDRDIWKWELPWSDEVNSFLFTLPHTFSVWDGAAEQMEQEEGMLDFMFAGTAIVKYRNALVDMIVANHYVDTDGVPVTCAPVLHSEVGHRLLQMYPEAPYSATFLDEYERGTRKWSLRSEEGREFVDAIAKWRGGGGHGFAAGYREELDYWD